MSNLPMSLVRERIARASEKVSNVQLAMWKPGFDQNDATRLLGEALGILDSLLIQPKQETKGNY